MQDIATGAASAGQVAKAHSREAGRDMKQWGHELKKAAQGDLPGEAKVRDLPPMTEADTAESLDRVAHKPTASTKQEQRIRGDKYNQN